MWTKYNSILRHVMVAEVTTNLTSSSDPANLFIEVATAEGQAFGLAHDSLVTCPHLITMTESRLGKVIGKLSAGLL
jgi:hypothetical protein